MLSRVASARKDRKRKQDTARTVAEAARAAEEAATTAAEARARPKGRPSDIFLGEFRRRDVFPLLVLHFVAQEPSYGNNLIAQIETLTAGVMSVNPNTIYPLLREMEANGLITGQWEHPEKRSRRFYGITAAGGREYERLRQAVRPFLEAIVDSVGRIKGEIYGTGDASHDDDASREDERTD